MTSKYLYGVKHGRFLTTELDWAKCGRMSNYYAHLRRGQKPCTPCQEAAARYWMDNRRKKKAREQE